MNSTPSSEEELLSQSFDSIADDYDRFRDTHSQKVVSDICELTGMKPLQIVALEIGCGTGQATRSFANTVASIHCIDPGSNLIVRARENLKSFSRVHFQCARFEDYFPSGKYDLVYAAQSFHWVDKNVRYQKVSECLKPGGLFAAFWKRSIPRKRTDLENELVKVYQRFLPDYVPENLDQYERDNLADLKEMVNCNLFDACQVRRYPEPINHQSSVEFANLLSTWSVVAALPELKRKDLVYTVGQVVDSFGGQYTWANSETALFAGYKRI